MTLTPYSPDKLDALSLRLLDLASVLRRMSRTSREHEIDDLTLHDRKVQQWCANLERWAHKASAELDLRVLETRTDRRARSTGLGEPD